MLRRLLVFLALCGLPAWSCISVVRGLGDVQWNLIVETRSLTLAEWLVVSHLLILCTWSMMVIHLAGVGRRNRRMSTPDGGGRQVPGVMGRATAWLSASAVLAPGTVGTAPAARIEASLPVGTVLSPAMAASVLAFIIRRRREQAVQVGFSGRPDRLTDAESGTLGNLRRLAIEYDSHDRGVAPIDSATDLGHDRLALARSNPDVHELLDAVERPSASVSHLDQGTVHEWQVVVKVFGYPLVANPQGMTADFRKKRALELLTWLSLNRNRQRRSAARTALWEMDVSDGTFSTVVWEMRRSLAELYPASDTQEWCPATYSDEIPLKSTVVTDADLLEDALHRFRDGGGTAEEVSGYLDWIRDVPFAGTTYSWADLDGTTTRLVILAIDAATTVARWAMEHERPEVLTEAVAAGLRVMPGCEELLELQEQLVRSKPTRSVARSRR